MVIRKWAESRQVVVWCHVQTHEKEREKKSVNAHVTFACMYMDVLRANGRGLHEQTDRPIHVP